MNGNSKAGIPAYRLSSVTADSPAIASGRTSIAASA